MNQYTRFSYLGEELAPIFLISTGFFMQPAVDGVN